MWSAASQRAVALAALTAGAVACDGGSRRAPAADPTAACAAAHREAAAAAPVARAAILARGCPACGGSLTPLLDVADGRGEARAIEAAARACQPGCPKSALATWRAGLVDAVPGSPSGRPWRALAEACEPPFALPDDQRRFASGPLFALTAIGRRAAPPAPLAVPLPPWTATGTGLTAPPGVAAPLLPWRAVSIFDPQLVVGRLAVAILDGGGLRIDAPAPAFPGAVATDVTAALAALPAPPLDAAARTDDVLVIAPRAMAASRALAVLTTLGSLEARLAVAVEPSVAAWRGAVAPHVLPWRAATGPRLRLDLASRRIATIGADGAVRAMAAPDDLAAVWAAAAGRTVELVAAAPADLDVAALVALADAAHAAGVTALAATAEPVPPSDAPFDPAALAP